MAPPILTSRDFSGNVVMQIPYQTLEVGYSLNTPTYINFEVEKNQIDPAFLEPYRYDFRLKNPQDFLGPLETLGGIFTGYTVDYYSEIVQCSGQDYLHYLERRTHDGLDSGTPTAYAVTGRRLSMVIKDLIDKAVTNGVAFITSGINSALGPIIDYRIEPGDSESLFSKVMSLADTAGLYIKIIDKTVTIFGYSTAPSAIYDWIAILNNVLMPYRIGASIEYEGIIGTDILTLAGGGANNTRLYKKSSDATARTTYRRHDQVIDLSNVQDQLVLDTHNLQELQRGITPIKNIELVFHTKTEYPNYWIPLFASIPLAGLKIGAETITQDYRVISATHQTSDGGETFRHTYKFDLASMYDAP